MKISSETPSTLALTDTGAKGFVIAATCFFLACCLGYFRVFENNIPGVILFVGIGLYFLIIARYITIRIDKDPRLITRNARGILSTSIKNCNFTDIIGVEMHSRFNSGAIIRIGRGPKETYQLVLALHDGTLFNLDNAHTVGFDAGMPNDTNLLTGLSGIDLERELGRKIASFIGVPFQDMPSSGGPSLSLHVTGIFN